MDPSIEWVYSEFVKSRSLCLWTCTEAWGLGLALSSQVCDSQLCGLASWDLFSLPHPAGCAVTVKVLMVSCLACDVPRHGQHWRERSGILSKAVHSQVHHDNSRHFRGNYQRVSLNNQFPSAPGAVLTRKGKKEGTGCVLGWGQYSPGEQYGHQYRQFPLS